MDLDSRVSRFARSSSLPSGRDRFLDAALVLALVARVLGSDSSKPGVVPGVDLDGVESKTGVELVPWVSGLNERRLKLRRPIVVGAFSPTCLKERDALPEVAAVILVIRPKSNNDA